MDYDHSRNQDVKPVCDTALPVPYQTSSDKHLSQASIRVSATESIGTHLRLSTPNPTVYPLSLISDIPVS